MINKRITYQPIQKFKKIKNIRSAAYYLRKYLNKELEEEPKNQGRYWGCSRNWGDRMHESKLTGRQLVSLDD